MPSLPQLLRSIYGQKKVQALVMEYRQTFADRHLVLRDLAMKCEIGAAAPSTAIACVKQAAKQEVFAHIARILEIKPEDFIATVDGTVE